MQTIADPAWTNLATIVATGTNTSYCLPLTTPYHYFQVLENGGTPPPPPSSIINPALTFTTNDVCLAWASVIGAAYQVQAMQSIVDTAWTNLAAITATSTNSTYCLPLPTPYRFFQVLTGSTNAPPPSTNTSFIDPSLSFGTNGLCLTWPSQAPLQYDVQAKLTVSAPAWTNVASVTATGPLSSYCLPTNTPFQFFQIAVKSGTNPGTGGANPLSLHSPVILADGRFQFLLDAVPGTSYDIQVTTNLTPVVKWTTLTNVVPAAVTVTITDTNTISDGIMRFYRVLRR
jgi:hypothetical protein